MVGRRDRRSAIRPPLVVGLLGSLGLIGSVAIPVLVAEGATGSVIRAYYSFGIGGLWVVGALAVVLGLIMLAGLTNRSDPIQAASIGLGIGLVVVLVSAIWAVSVPTSLVTELGSNPVLRYHRWLTVLLSLVPPAASLWGASRLEVV